MDNFKNHVSVYWFMVVFTKEANLESKVGYELATAQEPTQVEESQFTYEDNSPVSPTFDQPGIYHSIADGGQGQGCQCPEHKSIDATQINDDFSIIETPEESPAKYMVSSTDY